MDIITQRKHVRWFTELLNRLLIFIIPWKKETVHSMGYLSGIYLKRKSVKLLSDFSGTLKQTTKIIQNSKFQLPYSDSVVNTVYILKCLTNFNIILLSTPSATYYFYVFRLNLWADLTTLLCVLHSQNHPIRLKLIILML